MLKDRMVYLRGDFIPWSEAKVHLMSHSVGRGSAIFEVLSFHNTVDGPAVFRLDEHLERLLASAALLGMELPMRREEFQEAVLKTVNRNGLREGFIKIICFYPQVAFSIFPPREKPDVSIFVVDPSHDLNGVAFPFEKGTTAGISKWRKLDPETVPVEAKAAANYLNGIMAKEEARKRGFEEAIMLDTQGFIAEGGTESIFLVKDGRLMTPGLGTVLKSISRKSVLEVATVMGVKTVEGRLLPELLFTSEELFFSGTPIKVLAVRQIEERVIEKVPGPVTKKLFEAMKNIVSGKDERFKAWLFPVT
jgi:branched-chain amino acid aminotransferase